MKKVFMIIGLAVAFASQAADYTLDFRAATPVASEAPVLRKAEMPLAVGQIPSVAVGDAISLTLFEDVTFALRIVSAPPAGIVGQSFIAKDENGSASAVVKVTAKTARISVDDFMNRRQYTVRCKDGKVLIVERDNSQVDDGECGTCGGDIEVPQSAVEETKTTSTKKARTLLGASGNDFPLAEQKSVVDILVAFDKGAKAWAEKGSNWENGGDSIEEFADYAVNKMNMVLEKSQLLDTFSYRLAGVVAIDDTYTQIDQTLLGNLRTRAGALSKLSQLRDKYGADTITLLIDRTQGTATGVGFGYYPVSSFPDPGTFDRMNYACNICDIKTVYERYTMSHETGHNMGCDHSTRQGPTNSGPGRFEDSSGYHFVDTNGVRRYTIMGYNYTDDDDYNYSPVPYFSSPDISPDEYGCAVGVEGTNNNRRTLLQTHGDIAGLREHVLPYDWDVRFLDDNGNDISDGTLFYSSTYVTLTNANPEAEIYYTLDGTTPTSESLHGGVGTKVYAYLVYGPKTLTACAVVDGKAQSVRSITLHDGLTWSGDANGNGLWLGNDSSVLPWNGKSYYSGDAVMFPDLAGVSSATVTVKGAVAPGSVSFSAINTAYTFDKGDDDAKITLSDANFAPAGDVTFNVPVQLSAMTFTNMTGCVLTFNAPFGQTVDATSGYCTNLVTISPYGKMTVAPGKGKIQTFDTLNNMYFAGTSTFRVGEGTVVFNGGINGGAGVIGRTKLEVGNGGELVFNMGGGTGHEMNQTSLTVETGGAVTFNQMEHTRRDVILKGGTINCKTRWDLMYSPAITVTDDSVVANAGSGYINLRFADVVVNVAADKTFEVNIPTQEGYNTSGWGIIKRGKGKILANAELKHSGVTDIEEGTIEVGYSSGSTAYGQGWIVASNSTLRVKSGCSLKVPSLTLDPTSIISLPVATSAPLVVNGNVDLTDVRISIQAGGDLSLGASYPLISATGNISGIKSLVRESWPKLGTGLGWKIAVSVGVLTASIVNAAESDPYVDFVTNIQTSRLALPSDATMTDDGGLKFASSPIAITSLSTRAFTMSLDVDIPAGLRNANQTICSWSVGGNIIRCVITNGVLDCFHGANGHTDNATDFIPVTSGRHAIKVGYNSDGDYPGTCVYVDGTLAYTASGLKWGGKDVTRITVGATAADTPAYPYEGLILHALALANPNSTEALPKMTSSGGQVTYNYLAAKSLPHVFALTPNGGFETCNAILPAKFSGTYEALSVSILASFPEDATGTIFSSAVKDSSGYAYATQVEYREDGALAFRDNGNSSLTATCKVSADMTSLHLYTMTYKMGVGFKLYMDGEELLTNSEYFYGKDLPAWARVVFGCGYWTNWITSWNGNPNPMPNLKVYASHIALGTDDRTVSEAVVKEATGYEPEEPEEPVEPDPEPPIKPENRLPVVDVLVAFDNGAYAYVAEKSMSLEAFAEAQIAKMNDALATNRLDACYSYRLAGVCKVDATYRQINAISTELAEGVGPLIALRAQRELYGADTVTLLIDNVNDATLGYGCPLSTTDVAGCHDDAFSVCSIKAVHVGKQHTMLHENAHNMGCGHADNVQACSPFAYGRGYYFDDPEDLGVSYHTIMAYGGDDDASWYFSTSDNEYPELYRQEYGYIELGDANHDNRRVLTETCGIVSQWRDYVKPFAEDVIAMDPDGEEILSGRVFKEAIQVVLSSPDDAAIYYTTDGTAPTSASSVYSSPLYITEDTTLMVASINGATLSPVRTIKLFRMDAIPDEGVWRTSAKYPWSDAGQGVLRSFNYTEYGHKCTTPLSVKVEGPKLLRFKHKSYFSTPEVDSNYSHVEVLLDDSVVLSTNYFDIAWSDDVEIVIPSGEHDVQFVYSQRDSLHAPLGNFIKNGNTPLYDEALWLKDIEFDEVPRVKFVNCSSTSDNVEWTFPYINEAKDLDGNLGGIEVVTKGIVETLGFGSTNAVVLSVLAELPEEEEGALMGLLDVRALSKHPVYAYANGDGTITIYYDSKTNTASSVASQKLDISGLHIWTLAYYAEGGARFYMDGNEVASDLGIKWTNNNNNNNNLHTPAEHVTFGSAGTDLFPLAGMKIYAVHSDFGANDGVFNAVSSSVDSVLSSFDCLSEYADKSQATKLALLRIYKDTGSVIGEAASECVLRISEIMPKPTDDRTLNGREGMDVNGLESGWVEVENTSDQWADLKDYRFIRVNRGKKTDPAGYGNFPSKLIPPYGRAIFYTSERYSNSKDKSVSAFTEGTFDGKPMIFEDYGNILVWGDKVNPKKSPYVRLYYAPGGDSDKGTVVDTVVVPSDLPEGWSIIIGDAEEGEGTRRWMCPTPTRNAKNSDTAKLTRIGPNVGPLYERPDQKKTDLASEFAAITPPAVPGTDYTVTLPINAVMNPDGTFTPRTADQIQSIKFVYRKDLDDATLVTNDIEMATKSTVENWGDQYTATIPASYFPAAGHLIQWKVLITDGEGTVWTSPSFNNPDDGYEWYGTIVEAPGLESATLPTWHMFASGNHLTQMDVDKDDQNLSLVPNYARIAIYDSSTSNYYDYVRIDLRGNTSANFTKKGHGLRFAKAHPLTMRDIVSGEDIEDIRKTSLISEFADPSYMRQMIAFWLWRKMGNLVPFDFPVRCNLNGEFYQLAFNSERFTDELIEDVYGLDKFGYGYKNVGTLKSGSSTTAGNIEKKTPDDEDESNTTVLESELRSKITAAQDKDVENHAELTKFVVQKFNLPAWINYLASARITQEMDDVWANVCAYYDNPDMKEGNRGTGTWMPLGYDFNLSFGQYYYGDLNNTARFGLSANQDWFKSHPLYGGNRIVAHKKASNGEAMNGNDGFESIYQSAKFRRLYLRRLRTLMDQELKAPGTPEAYTPFMAKMREMADLMRTDATSDQNKWSNNDTDDAIDVWTTRPATMDAGIQDIWDNYVVPRRQHLYVTHSVTNTAKAIGYGSDLNAGIPEAQSPIATLAPNIVLDFSQHADGVVVVSNLNNEVVDMSGWTLKFGVEWTLPAGTVCDSNDCIYVVSDRRAYIEAHNAELTDQVIVGNATFSDWSAVYFDAADGTVLRGVSSDDSVVTFEAKDQKAADKLVAELSPALTEEDATAGLQAKYLKVVAEPTGKKNEFVVAVAVNPETVNAPVIAEPAAECEPVEIEEDDKGDTTVSVSISNAVKGLWYGYEVADELGDASMFANDVPSFERATDAAHTVTGSSRTQPSGFFRLKVLPAKPSE